MHRKLMTTALALLAFAVPLGARAATPDGFTAPSYVDTTLHGGEPLVLDDTVHHTLIYTSHEGTTHLYRPGFTSLEPVLFNYRNQVNMWTSVDGGASWQRVIFPGGFQTNPAQNTGFSDPDLTQDEGGRVYNTGIDLVNDAIFSSNDGGRTWDKGTPNCHNGDRPWLAGGKKDQVFMASNTLEGPQSGHEIFESTDGGNTCSSEGVPDTGPTPDGGSYTGYGKLYYDHRNGKLVEPVIYTKNNKAVGIGASVWKPGDTTITPVKVANTTLFSHFPILIFDNSDNLYLIWDTDERRANTTGPCQYDQTSGENAPLPLPNHVKMAYSKDFGKTWSETVDIASPPNARVLWPWAVAGDAGKLSIVWYQIDKLVDPDCEPANVSIYEARVENATDPAARTIDTVNAAGRPIHQNSVCQGGTLCVASGKDRRLGDFFTNSLDARGCVMIASADTTQVDPNTGGPMATSLPVILRQSSGGPLQGSGTCGTTTGQPGGPPVVATNTGRPTCRDRTPPTSTLKLPKGYARRGNKLRFRGRSKDRGCRAAGGLFAAAGKVARVYVSLARVGRHDCTFIDRKGELTRKRSCRKAIFLRARGTTKWTFGITVHVPPGNYRAVVRAVDVAGNKETPSARRDIIRFRLPRR